jgi:hypothetical protein
VCYTLHSDRRENQPAVSRVIWSGGKTGGGLRTNVSKLLSVFIKLCGRVLSLPQKRLP